MIRVLLVDDQNLIRTGIAGLLSMLPDIQVVGEATDGDAAIELIEKLQPDVVLLDVRMPKKSGIAVLQELNARQHLPATILLTTFDDDEALFAGMRAGAKGFLLKDICLERLSVAIRSVARGESLFRPAITERVLHGIHKLAPDFVEEQLHDPLTQREVEILALMAGGFNNREIAEAQGTSEGTVKNQVSSILSKMAVRDRVRAVLRGLELGII
ncbi:response regulator [Undibacterium sp. JH2W]|uniref:response regulator n=1 Tax=Undibacterium sp. JH2W TaxID=3413037 RepID=UPI003BF28629